MNGVQLASWLRAQAGGGEVRLVGVSADLDSAGAARAAGVERLLQKPIGAASIDELVRSTPPQAPPEATSG